MSEGWGWLGWLLGEPRIEGEPTPDTEKHERELAKERPPKAEKKPPRDPARCHECCCILGDHYVMVDMKLLCLRCAKRIKW